MELKYRFWFEDQDGKYLFGEGLYLLLKYVDETHNLSKAVKMMKMSYRNGWGRIKEVEERLGKKIVETKRGGSISGETRLTEYGKKLITEYERYLEVFDYYSKRPYKIPSLTVDGIINEGRSILLIKRKNEPYMGYYALPGGFVEYGETVEEAIKREIFEETGLEVKILNILGVYSSPDRDPRGHTISIVYILDKISGHPRAGDDAEDLKFFEIKKIPDLAFDHNKIINDYIKLLNHKT
ncbi:MAG: NUDIX domain-containing protein [Thermoplasmata archaeon]|jgi:8-oxo-dGTP diphosphatase|nr:NUDIX domain-containing protein [Thermoplasmata archaeon]MVT13728.1 NUDIX domain-containing protein [Euryarchaeota archaeon]